MQKRTCTLILALALVLVAPLLFAEGAQEESESEAQEQVTITWAPHWTNYIDTTLADLAEEFEAQNPNVTIELEAVQNYNRAMRTRLAANELPDVVRDLGLDKEDYPQYYLPLNDLFEPEEVWNYYKVTGTDSETVYALPVILNYTGVVYNRSAFEEAGVSEVPRTIEELWDVAEQLKEAGITPVGTGFQQGWPLGMFFRQIPRALAGNTSLHNELAANGGNPFENEHVIQSLDVIRGFHERGYMEEDPMSAAWSSLAGQIAGGDKAMAFLATWYPPQIVMNGAEEENLGMFPFPGSDYLTAGGGASYGVAAGSEHPEIAKEFLKFQLENERIAGALGAISSLRDAETDFPWVEELTSYEVEDTLVRAPESELYRAIMNEMQFNRGAFIQDYVLSDDPEEVLAEYAQDFNEAREAVQ
jgi:raffinose/stachyose/melibiose transport system substrate-binding protein